MVSLLENTERDGTVADETGTVPAKDGKATDEGTQAASPFPEATKLVEDIQTLLGLEAAVRDDGWVDLHVDPQKVQEVAFRLRDELKINYLSSLAAVDWKDEGFEVVYHILELGTPRRIVMRARVPRDDASLPTVVPVWPTANWHEREAWDLMGVHFEGHPDLRRILMREDWVGHPLRKDYVDERPQRVRQVKPW